MQFDMTRPPAAGAQPSGKQQQSIERRSADDQARVIGRHGCTRHEITAGYVFCAIASASKQRCNGRWQWQAILHQDQECSPGDWGRRNSTTDESICSAGVRAVITTREATAKQCRASYIISPERCLLLHIFSGYDAAQMRLAKSAYRVQRMYL